MDLRHSVPTIYGDWQQRFGAGWDQQLQKLKDKFGGSIQEVTLPASGLTDVPIVWVEKRAYVDLISFLKNEPGFEYGFLADLTATDESPEKPRFHLIVQLFSHSTLSRIRVKVRLEEGEEAPTLVGVWPAANWAEREVWDMFGIRFHGHPDLRRILMDERWQGHPLRKDYPLRGYQFYPLPAEVNTRLLEDN